MSDGGSIVAGYFLVLAALGVAGVLFVLAMAAWALVEWRREVARRRAT